MQYTDNVRVVVVEDDPFARNLMVMLLARDWRTRIVADFMGYKDLSSALLSSQDIELTGVELFLINIQKYGRTHLPISKDLIDILLNKAVVFIGEKEDPKALAWAIKHKIDGYILKDEIQLSLASALTLAAQKHFVITPRIEVLAQMNRVVLPDTTKIICPKTLPEFTSREHQISRLAILFNFSGFDLADEVVMNNAAARKIVSNVYKKLSLNEILGNIEQADNYIHDDFLLTRFKDMIKKHHGSLRNIANKATFAFHLFSTLEIRDVASKSSRKRS